MKFEEYFSMLNKETLDVIDLNHLSLHQIIKDVGVFFSKKLENSFRNRLNRE